MRTITNKRLKRQKVSSDVVTGKRDELNNTVVPQIHNATILYYLKYRLTLLSISIISINDQINDHFSIPTIIILLHRVFTSRFLKQKMKNKIFS